MYGLSIGEVGRKAGLSVSALRYYEKAGLLPAPMRSSKQRRYDPAVFARISIIKLALEAGFTIAETRTFLSGFSASTRPSARWRSLATRKLDELNALSARVERMKLLLENSFRCDCLRLEDCETVIRARQCKKEC